MYFSYSNSHNIYSLNNRVIPLTNIEDQFKSFYIKQIPDNTVGQVLIRISAAAGRMR